MTKTEFHVTVTENHTVNGVAEHRQYQLDINSKEVLDEHLLQHLTNFAREAINHDGHPKKYFATSPPKPETVCIPGFH
jgi:hypothetical protein